MLCCGAALTSTMHLLIRRTTCDCFERAGPSPSPSPNSDPGPHQESKLAMNSVMNLGKKLWNGAGTPSTQRTERKTHFAVFCRGGGGGLRCES